MADEVVADSDRRGHDHAHVSAAVALSAGGRYRHRLALALGLVAVFFAVELVAGLLTGSLALLGDAGHMLTDVVGLGMALAAVQAATRHRAHPQRSFGVYRLEILAALANAGLLLGIAGFVLYEAAQRLVNPPEIAGGVVLAVAAVGLLVNLVTFALLRQGAKESLNLEGAALEVLVDAVSSVGVILAAVITMTTGWRLADPLIAAAIGVFIIPRALHLGRRALHVLLQAAPDHIDVGAMERDLSALADVIDVHDLHVWTLTSAMDVASAHVMVRAEADTHAVLDRARALLAERYHIEHATLQVEPETHTGCEEVVW